MRRSRIIGARPRDARVAQGDGARAAFGDAGIVRDDQDGGAQALVEIADEVEDFGAGVGVEVAGRLIGQQDGRMKGQRARDGDALPLAAGKFVGQVIEAVAELHEVQQLARAAVDLRRGQSFQVQGQGDVFHAGQSWAAG